VNMTRCEVIVKEAASRRPLPARWCPMPKETFRFATVEDQISDFLDGKTHGETVLHALYDHVLDEPIPERLRLLLKK
jgi:anti-sigma factor NepR-like protein